MKKVLIVIGVVLVVGGLGGFLFWQDYKSGALENRDNLPAVGQEFPSEGRDHVAVGTPVQYKTNPPTSGNHYADPAEWGVYEQQLDDRQLVHNLEHGGIWISYKPDIDADTKAKLEDIARKHDGSVIVEPRAQNDTAIAIVSWTRMEKLDTFNRDKIEEFITHNINKSPEPLAKTFNM